MNKPNWERPEAAEQAAIQSHCQPVPSCDCGKPGQWRGDRMNSRIFCCDDCHRLEMQHRLRPLEQAMFNAGWVRCPNNPERWYAGNAGKLQPAYPMELRVLDEIWLIAKLYGNGDRGGEKFARLMRFETVARLESYLERNGVAAEAAAPFSNSWD